MNRLNSRVLPARPLATFADYVAGGGGEGLRTAQGLGSAKTIELLDDSGLRGRGGAGFPTGRKWRTIVANCSEEIPTVVVVNGAEGEPGTFKDRQILRFNPYGVIEGALIAATAVDASDVVIAVKASFVREKARLAEAIGSATDAGWTEGIAMHVVDGPSTYLFGEETAMLEVIEGRPSFPRISPPYRRGLQPEQPGTGHSAAGIQMATPDGSDEAPTLIDNVETLAHVALIGRDGAEWFRSVGTDASPGTVVCTISGATARHGVGEFEMGTPLREVIDTLGGGARPGRRIIGVLPGVSNPWLGESALDTPLTYEDMARAGSGLGSAGFIVLDDATDLRLIAGDVARFLAIESCGQCERCKSDGLSVAGILAEPGELPVDRVQGYLDTVSRGARCALAGQIERVVGSLVPNIAPSPENHDGHTRPTEESRVVLPMVDLVEDTAVLDTSHLAKQPDWSFDEHDSGLWPVQRLADRPVHISTPRVPEAPKGTPSSAGADPALFTGLRESHRDLEEAVDRLRRAGPGDCPAAASELHEVLSRHLDLTQRFLHPAAIRVEQVAGEEIIGYPEVHEREALRLLDRIECSGVDAPGRVLDEVAADVHRYVIEVELRILPLIEKHMDRNEQVKLDRAIETARLAANRRSS
jgi:NADH:ubiquinone oxidoreductase subunit F (NADH-binding)